MIVLEAAAITTRWTRMGECNHCGACCQNLSRQVLKITGGTEVDRPYLELRGAVPTGAQTFDLPVWVHAPCVAHESGAATGNGGGGRCAIYDRRPRTCRDFPWRPDQVVGTPCSYRFERQVNGRTEIIAGDAVELTPIGESR